MNMDGVLSMRRGVWLPVSVTDIPPLKAAICRFTCAICSSPRAKLSSRPVQL